MAEINNITEINENFDTIKTLLNSIRAQGILNTSDVDKLLTGINSKLERINTDEDVNLIKIFLTELKQNLEERHSVLLSKFGAIESLFSNLLKNSSETLKSSEIKELFDIVATNLSVFSREIVSQKDTLSDIILRLDAIQSDDSLKKDIVKSVSVLKNDIDRISNGFDSIVLSLNENFKTVLKNIAEIDNKDSILEFGNQIADIMNSSNTILSALQLIDKKQVQLEDSVSALPTVEDINSARRSLNEIYAINKQVSDSVEIIAEKNYKLDNLSEKIDASVNIIAGLKAVISESSDKNSSAVLNRLNEVENFLKEVVSTDVFEDLKSRLEVIIHDIINNCVLSFNTTGVEIKEQISTDADKVAQLVEVSTTKTNTEITNLKEQVISESANLSDIIERNTNKAMEESSKLNSQVTDKLDSFSNNFYGLISEKSDKIGEEVQDVKANINEQIANESNKTVSIFDSGVTKIVEDLNSRAELINSRLSDTHSALAEICRTNFTDLTESLAGLKAILNQVDENNVSANNAIFSNITDRLAIFENSLKASLEKQEDFLSGSSQKVVEQMTEVKNLSGTLDYKLDASMIEINNSKKEFQELQTSVQNVLDLDFVNVVKDLRVDLYAIKQDLKNAMENESNELSDKISEDLFRKYELLVSKLDNVEDEINRTQRNAIEEVKTSLDNISSSIIDILSYVSTARENNSTFIDDKIENLTKAVNDNSLNYVDNVRDIVEVVKIKIENYLEEVQKNTSESILSLNSAIAENADNIKSELRNSYSKLLEVQDNFDEIKEQLNVNNITNNTNLENILTTTESIKGDFDKKLTALKNVLLEKVTEYKNEFACDNADKFSELRFNAESMHSKSVQNITEMKDDVKNELEKVTNFLNEKVEQLSLSISDTLNSVNSTVSESVKDLNETSGRLNDDLAASVSETINRVDTQISNVVSEFGNLDSSVKELSKTTSESLTATLAKILENFVSVKSVINSLNEQSAIVLRENVEEIKNQFENLKEEFRNTDSNIDEDLTRQFNLIEHGFQALNSLVTGLMDESKAAFSDKISREFEMISNKMDLSVTEKLENYKSKIETLFDDFNVFSNSQSEFLKEKAQELNNILNETLEKQHSYADTQLNEISQKLKNILDENIEASAKDYESLKEMLDSYSKQLLSDNRTFVDDIKAQLDDVTQFVDSGLSIQAQEVNTLFDQINSGMEKITVDFGELDNSVEQNLSKIHEKIEILKSSNHELIDEKTSNILNLLEQKIDDLKNNSESFLTSKVTSLREYITELDEKYSQKAISGIEEILSNQTNNIGQVKNFVNENYIQISEDVKNIISQSSDEFSKTNQNILTTAEAVQNTVSQSVKEILDELENIQGNSLEKFNGIKNIVKEEVQPEILNLSDRIHSLFEENSLNIVTELSNNNTEICEELKSNADLIKKAFESLNERMDKDELSQMNVYQAQVKELSATFNSLIDEAKEVTKSEVASICETLINNSRATMDEVNQSFEEKINTLLATNADIAAGELQTIESFATSILAEVEGAKQNTLLCRDLIVKLIKEEINILNKNIEKETDIISGDIIEQLNLLRDSQKDDLTLMTSQLEGSVSGYIIDSVNDLKSYLDIKTDNTVLNEKFDNLRYQLSSTADNITDDIGKLVELSVFTNAISDLKSATETLVASMAEKLNNQIEDFVKINVSQKLGDKLNILDKKFIDTVVGKYEEIKQISLAHNSSFENITQDIQSVISEFELGKSDLIYKMDSIAQSINGSVENLIQNINGSIENLEKSFEGLKAQILNKSFDEAFQTSLNNQILGIEAIVKEQTEYLEDISELCCNNLPEITEMSVLVKHNIQESISDLSKKVNSQNIDIESSLNNLKSDIITQFLNIFNQISFVAEQEEILDFIQEKHSELITILSHIVTTADGVENVKDNIAVVDNKMDSLKEDVDLLNEKITAIMSSDGNVDYVYSLQDLESDIANLRIVLNEMKKNINSKEDSEEFKQKFNELAEDIVSISTRTNKLILASDESNKSLQDNLNDFRLVINDLDERTRNFSKEAGIENIDNKLGAINTMIQNGVKTNQIFNQVFEYLAEWVDKAGAQITSITDKVETLDDISQIKLMLQDLKAEAEDDTESNELVEALGNVFDKQAKRISSLEAKLDRIIVDNTINKKEPKLDVTPFEDTLNRFLVAIDDKIVSQQRKILSLETKLEEVVSLIDNKDTAQLTKKVGGMDRQIAKLNKNIEKIASHVVEK